MIKKFIVPANYSKHYIDKIDEMNRTYSNKVVEIYGTTRKNPIGTIRPKNTIQDVTEFDFKEYVSYAAKRNIKFNYILNATFLDGMEYSLEGRKKIIDFIKYIYDLGVEEVTVTIPFLFDLIKEYVPKINISASICAEIDSINKVDNFIKIGADSFVMAKDVNRNFRLLKKINEKYPNKMKLLATTPCIYRCHNIFYHMNLSTLQSNGLMEHIYKKGEFNSHTAILCQKQRLENIAEYIRSPYIRPEDLEEYKKIGVNFFKLDGRDRPEEYNLNVIEAYMKESFSGNLLYLMQMYYPASRNEFLNVNLNKPIKLGVYLDNKKMNGFLHPFVKEELDCEKGCNQCKYCDEWANKIIELNKENVEAYLNLLDRNRCVSMTIEGGDSN